MSERCPSFDPEPTGRERAIAAMGKVLFDYERGPNAHTPEVIAITPETAPEIDVEPIAPVTDDEASYIAGTLGPAAAE